MAKNLFLPVLLITTITLNFIVYEIKEANAQTVVDEISLGPESGNGIDPVATAINTTTNRLYMANEFSDNVSVIDSLSYEVINVIDVGDSPADIKINPVTNLVYVSNSESNDISLIDGTTDQVIGAIAVGNSPKGIAINTVTNRIYIVNQDSNNISVINGASNEAIETIATGGTNPSYIAVNSTTNLLYVDNSEDNTVNVLDGSNNKSIATIDIGVTINAIEVNETNNHIYVAGCCANNTDIGMDIFTGEIIIINGSTNEIIARVSIGCSRSPGLSSVCSSNIFDIAVNEAANQVYVSNFDMYFVSLRDFEFVGFLSVIDGLSLEVTDNVEIRNDPRGIAVDSLNNLIYVANKGSDDASAIDGSKNNVISSVNLARLPFGIDVAPETNRIYVSNISSNDVSVINSLTNETINNVPVGISPQNLVVNQKNNQIYIANENSHTVSVIDGLSNEVVNTINVGCNPVDVAINHATNNIYVAVAAKFGGMRICDNFPSITVIDSSTNKIITTIANNSNNARPVSIAINSKTNRIYATYENNNSVYVVSVAERVILFENFGRKTSCALTLVRIENIFRF